MSWLVAKLRRMGNSHGSGKFFRAEDFSNDPAAFRVFVKKRNKFIPGMFMTCSTCLHMHYKLRRRTNRSTCFQDGSKSKKIRSFSREAGPTFSYGLWLTCAGTGTLVRECSSSKAADAVLQAKVFIHSNLVRLSEFSRLGCSHMWQLHTSHLLGCSKQNQERGICSQFTSLVRCKHSLQCSESCRYHAYSSRAEVLQRRRKR